MCENKGINNKYKVYVKKDKFVIINIIKLVIYASRGDVRKSTLVLLIWS